MHPDAPCVETKPRNGLMRLQGKGPTGRNRRSQMHPTPNMADTTPHRWLISPLGKSDAIGSLCDREDTTCNTNPSQS